MCSSGLTLQNHAGNARSRSTDSEMQLLAQNHLRAVKSRRLSLREALQSIFDEVRVVDVMDSGDAAHLSLMKRPDLGVTFTKLHCWTLTHYSKCVFMDADTLVRDKADRFKTSAEMYHLFYRRKKKNPETAELLRFPSMCSRFCPTWTSSLRGRSCRRRRILVGQTASTPACLSSGRPTRRTRSCWSSAARTAALTVSFEINVILHLLQCLLKMNKVLQFIFIYSNFYSIHCVKKQLTQTFPTY